MGAKSTSSQAAEWQIFVRDRIVLPPVGTETILRPPADICQPFSLPVSPHAMDQTDLKQ